MGGGKHEHGKYGGIYPPGEGGIYPPQPGSYAPYPPIYSQDRAFDAYPPPQFPPPPLDDGHHHGHHHHGSHHGSHEHHASPYGEFSRAPEAPSHEHHASPYGEFSRGPEPPSHGHQASPYGEFSRGPEAPSHGHHASPYGEFSRGPEAPHHASPYGEFSQAPNRSLASGQLVKLHSQANSDYNLAVRHDGVVLAPANHSDPTQHWIKDMSWSTKVRDEKGFPAFALVNKMTNKALKHTGQEAQQVLLAEYDPSVFDESVLWTQSEEMGNGYTTLRMANNIKLNLDAYKGDKRSGGIKDGTPVILFKWKKQENQLWKIVPCE